MKLGQICFGNPSQEFQLDSEPYGSIVYALLVELGFDNYGHPETSNRHMGFSTELENSFDETTRCYRVDQYEIRPYYWGEDESLMDLPNLVNKNIGLEISWYKYCGRGMSCNKNLSSQEFCKQLRGK